MPNIAILVPAFNSRKTIEEALDSIATQQGIEDVKSVHLVDDRSTDDTVEIASRIQHMKPPLQISVRATNVGQWHNVNNALHELEPRAEWVLILHSDDIAKPLWVSTMAARIAACPQSVATICSSWDVLSADGRVRPGEDSDRPVELIRGERDSVRGTLLRGCWWHISGCAIRVAAFKDVGDFQPDLAVGDWEWLLRCLARGWSVEYVPRSLIVYRNHDASISSGSFRTHRDIREGLGVLRTFVGYLSLSEITRVHAKRGYHLVRRVATSIARSQFERLATALLMLVVTAASLASCLKVKLAGTLRFG